MLEVTHPTKDKTRWRSICLGCLSTFFCSKAAFSNFLIGGLSHDITGSVLLVMVLTTWTLPNVLVHKTINPQRWFTVHNTYSVFVCSYKDIMVLIDKFSDKITQHPQLDSEKLVRALEQAAVNACSMWCSTNCQGAWQMLGKTLFFRKKSDVAAFVLHYDSILDSVEVEINYV